jgi:DNA-binding transcriptional ArsR family regulator
MDTEAILKALANPVRRNILQWLKTPEQYFPQQYHSFEAGVCAGQIDQKVGLSQSTVSSHLAILQKAGLIRCQKVGQWSFYERNEQTIQQFLLALQHDL